MDIFTEVRNFAAAQKLFAGVEHVVVGFSGGIDSLALLLILRQLLPSVEAVHLQHGLRDDASDADAQWCRQACATLQIKLQVAELHVRQQQQRGESIESAARRCRQQFWQQYCRPGDAVALGHHADDCLEDLLLRLSRGANASGLSGLRPRRQIADILYLRPLLALRRSQLQAYVEQHWGHNWCEDASNADQAFRRNQIRHKWLPMICTDVGHDYGLQHSLAALKMDADYIEQQAAATLAAAPLTVTLLRQLHAALLPRVLRCWLQQTHNLDWLPRGKAIQRLQAVLQHSSFRQPHLIPLGGGPRLRLHADQVTLEPAPAPRLQTQFWAWQTQPQLQLPQCRCQLTASTGSADEFTEACSDAQQEMFAAASLPAQLQVRAWQPGDRMRVFAGGSKKLQDIFAEAAIARNQRQAVPVILAGETIIWVAGLRRAEFGRLLDPQQSAVLLQISEKSNCSCETAAGCQGTHNYAKA